MMAARKILVVDDEKNQRDILQMILTGEHDATGGDQFNTQGFISSIRSRWLSITSRAVNSRARMPAASSVADRPHTPTDSTSVRADGLQS